MRLNLPGGKTEQVKSDTALGKFAESVLGSQDKAALLFELNTDRLMLPQGLPAGAEVRLPQENYPSLVAFAILAAILMMVGFGWIFKTTPSEENGK